MYQMFKERQPYNTLINTYTNDIFNLRIHIPKLSPVGLNSMHISGQSKNRKNTNNYLLIKINKNTNEYNLIEWNNQVERGIIDIRIWTNKTKKYQGDLIYWTPNLNIYNL